MAHVLEVATTTGRDVDLHMDETLDAGVLHLAAPATMVDGFEHRVTASHCRSLGMQPAAVQAEVAAAVAAAGIAVVTLLRRTCSSRRGLGHGPTAA
jgi:cytosine deaminase